MLRQLGTVRLMLMSTSTRTHTTLTGFMNSYGFIAHSKIGTLLDAGLKNKYLVEIVGTFILVYAICSAATVYSGNVLLGIVGLGQAPNDWSRFSSCFCFNCNSLCYRIPIWSAG